MGIFNLRERIFVFVQNIFQLVKVLPTHRINEILIHQMVRSVTSIGANYEEADGTPTKKDFAYKMSLVKKEAKETKYWLQLVQMNNPKTVHTKNRRINERKRRINSYFCSNYYKIILLVVHWSLYIVY